MEHLRIFGAGTAAAKLVDLIAWQFGDAYLVDGFYDDRLAADATGPGGFPVLGSVADGLARTVADAAAAVVALGTRSAARAVEVFLDLATARVALPSFVAGAAHVSPSARIGSGTIVFPGVYVGAGVTIGHLCWAHGGVVVEHDATIGHDVVLGAAAVVGSASVIGSHSLLGNAAVTAPRSEIGRGTLVGAGSLVVGTLPSHVVAAGRPASVRRDVRAGDDVPSRDGVAALARRGLA